MILTNDERAHFSEQGYVVRESVLSNDECDALCRGLSSIIAAAPAGPADFWERMRVSHDRTEIFFAPSSTQDERAVMRIGHSLHRSAPFDGLARDPRIHEPLASAIGEPAEIVQSAVVYKQPESELVQFGWHQDSSYLPNEPESLVLAFVALDEMNAENGALEVLPGSHRDGLPTVYRLDPEGFVAVTKPRRSPTGPGVLLPLPRGSVVFVHGRTFHASAPNRSRQPRRAFILHAKARRSRMEPFAWALGPFDPLGAP